MKYRIIAPVLAIAITSVAAAAAQQPPATVRVHLDGDPRLVLEMKDEIGWTFVCQAPCDLRVPFDNAYRVNGEGIQHSRKFGLPWTYGEARLDVRPGAQGLHVFGIVTMAFGVSAMSIGLGTMLMSLLTESCGDCIGGFADTTAPNVAWALMGGGLAALIAGGVIIADTKTQVDVTTQEPPRTASNFLPERRALAAPPIIVGVPVFGVSFGRMSTARPSRRRRRSPDR